MTMQAVNSDSTYNLIKDGLKASNLRAKAIANNMANVNTEGYKRFNVIFEENLQKENNNSGLQLKTTNENQYRSNSSGLELKRTNEEHIASRNAENGDISIEQENGTSMKSDGNNVDLDVEKVNQAANTLKYNALISSINVKFNNLKTVLK